MADKTSPYTFRVIRGRVVPIKITERADRQALQYQRKKARYHEGKKSKGQRYGEAGAMIAAGGAGVVGAQFAAGKIQKYINTKLIPAYRFSKNVQFADRASKEAFNQIRRNAKIQAKILTRSKKWLRGGAVVGATVLAAKGFEKAVETYKGRPLSDRESVAYGTGFAATAGGAAAYSLGVLSGQGRKIGWVFKKLRIPL
jgi:hypothetical protein